MTSSYDMTHKERGEILIISNENFRKIPQRKNTDKDARRLESTFRKLGFKPTMKEDLTKDEMLQEVIKIAQKDHSNSDCVAIAIMTHGTQSAINGCDQVIGSDDDVIDINFLLQPLKESKTLNGKPKLIFIQACRGEKLDKGVSVYQCDGHGTVESDAPDSASAALDESDFLVCQSTTSGYYAWRKNNSGAVFMQALCDVLEANLDGGQDLKSMLLIVKQKVAEEYESNCNRQDMNKKKQMPEIQSQLRRKIFFTPKN